jgi:hypothetical protein
MRSPKVARGMIHSGNAKRPNLQLRVPERLLPLIIHFLQYRPRCCLLYIEYTQY